MRRAILGLACILAGTSAASAQTAAPGASRRVAIDSVVGYQDYMTTPTPWAAQYVLDLFSTAEVRPHWQVSFRPKVWKNRGTWEMLVDQVSIEHTFHKGSNWRVEAGRFPVPIGTGMMENRADLNAGMIWWHRAYYMPLPSLGADLPRVSLASAVYPEGLLASTSGNHWDARGALLDRGPVQFWKPPVMAARGPNVILGGGVTPRQGLRVGVAMAAGPYAVPTSTHGELGYAMLNVEGEYAFAYTKISGEWLQDRFETTSGDRRARGWTLQAQQTLTPRVFVHTRMSVIQSPEASRTVPATYTMRTYRSIDTTLGYRLSPQLTIRLGHSAMRSWTDQTFQQQVGLSLMWANRWW